MTDIAALDNDLNEKILTGKALEGFEKYYADDVVMQENSEAPFVGKELNRKLRSMADGMSARDGREPRMFRESSVLARQPSSALTRWRRKLNARRKCVTACARSWRTRWTTCT